MAWTFSSLIYAKRVRIQTITYSLSNNYSSGSMSKRNRSDNKKNALERPRKVSIASEKRITERMECH